MARPTKIGADGFETDAEQDAAPLGGREDDESEDEDDDGGSELDSEIDTDGSGSDSDNEELPPISDSEDDEESAMRVDPASGIEMSRLGFEARYGTTEAPARWRTAGGKLQSESAFDDSDDAESMQDTVRAFEEQIWGDATTEMRAVRVAADNSRVGQRRCPKNLDKMHQGEIGARKRDIGKLPGGDQYVGALLGCHL